MKLSVNDKFKIQSDISLNGEDTATLVELYMPIIGIDSYALYLLLNNLDKNVDFLFKKLIDSLNLSSLDLVSKAFSKLEAVSLVEVYYNEKNGYLIVLSEPLSKFEFLKNTVLSSFLRSQIGEVEFEKIKVQKPKIRGYKEITRSFDEVFKISQTDVSSVYNRIFKLKNKQTVKVVNPDFDYIFFKMTFDTSFMDPKILEDEDFKQHVITTSFTYQLNEEEMMTVIMDTMTIDKDLKYEDISKNARKFYQKKNKRKEPKFVTKEADMFINSETDDETFVFLERMNSINPEELLMELSGGSKASPSELKLFEDLAHNTNLPQSVINIMILFVNSEKDGVLPGYEYFEKIAQTWMRAKVKTSLDALNIINKKTNKKDPKKPQYQTVKKVAKLPDWYDKYKQELANAPKEDDSLTQTEIDAILEEAKKIYN